MFYVKILIFKKQSYPWQPGETGFLNIISKNLLQYVEFKNKKENIGRIQDSSWDGRKTQRGRCWDSPGTEVAGSGMQPQGSLNSHLEPLLWKFWNTASMGLPSGPAKEAALWTIVPLRLTPVLQQHSPIEEPGSCYLKGKQRPDQYGKLKYLQIDSHYCKKYPSVYY